jgi:transposase
MTNTTHLAFDVHAATIAIAKLEEGQAEPETWQIANDPAAIRKVIQRLRKKDGELRCCYEAGPCGYVLQRQMTKMGVHCDVIAPSLIPQRPGDRVKTDRRDAIKLVKLYRAGQLTPIGVPTEDQEAVRDLVRAREDVRRARSSARHRLTKFLLRHGHRFETCNWTRKFWSWISSLSFTHPEHTKVFQHYHDMVLYLDRQIEDLDQHIEVVAARDPFRTLVARLSCLRGISTLAAMVILSEVYDLRRFDSAPQFMAFLGVVPSEHSSGPKQRRGGITKTGNGHVRRILVEAAWSYRHHPGVTSRQRKLLVHQPPELADICRKADLRLTKRFRRLEARGKRTQVAMTAIARELAGFVWAVARLQSA